MRAQNELLDAIQILIDKSMADRSTRITGGAVKSASGGLATVTINGYDYSIPYSGTAPTVGSTVRVFIPNGNMSDAFIGGGGGGGSTGTTNYNNLTNKPSINGTTLSGNKTSTELGVYGTGNEPPYPVTSVNGQTGAVTINTDGKVTSVNGQTGDVMLNAESVGALPSTTKIPSATSDLTNDSGYITAAGAPVQSVAGKTGVVTLTKADVGLGNVDNTSDANKPISTATQTALNEKLDKTEVVDVTADAIKGQAADAKSVYDIIQALPTGTDISLGLTAATVGQTIKVKAVDTDGKPTAWQAVDMPRGGGDVWEFGGTIPLDLTTPTAIYEFAPCSIWKKVRIVRVRSSYNADLKSNVWYGASNCKQYGGAIWKQNLLNINNGYVYHYIEMMSDDDGGIIGTCTSSNNTNVYAQLQISSYSNNRVASNIPPTYGARSLTKDSNWMVSAQDPSAAWDGNETYYWWGVRA